MSESPLAPDNAASSAPATPQEPPKYGHIRGSQPGPSVAGYLSHGVPDCRAADSRNFEENSNRGWLQAPRKTSPKSGPLTAARPDSGTVVCKTSIRTASAARVRAIRATLSRKGSTVQVIQALFGCVVSAVRASLSVQRWKPLWLSGDGKRGASLFGCSISGASGRRCCPDTRGIVMMKIVVLATAASLAMLSAAAAADLPRKEPPPPAPPVGKAPIGKYPVGKYPVGKYPQPVVTKG